MPNPRSHLFLDLTEFCFKCTEIFLVANNPAIEERDGENGAADLDNAQSDARREARARGKQDKRDQLLQGERPLDAAH